ncbi:hypothetical protein 8AX6_1, partial [uncultured Caudovirales phage]
MATFAGVLGNLPAMNCGPRYDVGSTFDRALIKHAWARRLTTLLTEAKTGVGQSTEQPNQRFLYNTATTHASARQ